MRVKNARSSPWSRPAHKSWSMACPLQDLEKRMMYCTEGRDPVKDRSQLNTEFESRRDSVWTDAIQVIRNGDHCILVFWSAGPNRQRTLRVATLETGHDLRYHHARGFARPVMGYLMKNSTPSVHPRLLLADLLGIITASLIFPRQSDEQVAGFWTRHFPL